MTIRKLRPVKTPSWGTDQAAGLDFYVPFGLNLGEPFDLSPGESINIPSGISCEVPTGYALIAFNKSGVAVKQHLQVGACVVDPDYQGEVHLHVTNVGDTVTTITPGQKLVQFLLIPVLHEEIHVSEKAVQNVTQRGQGGFGSTGLH